MHVLLVHGTHSRNVVLGVAALAVAAGCSKPSAEEQTKQEAKLAAALSPALSAPATPLADKPAAAQDPAAATAALLERPVLATCLDVAEGTCTEYRGTVPTLATTWCEYSTTAKYNTSAAPCPASGVLGTCSIVDPPFAQQRYRYLAKGGSRAGSLDAGKNGCAEAKGTWNVPADPPKKGKK